MTDLQQEIKELIIDKLGLDDVSPDDIESDGPLFGEGLGLDSIDALEIALALEKHYQIKIGGDNQTKEHFYSIASLANLVESCRKAS